MDEHVDPAVALADLLDDGRQGRAVEQVSAAVVGHAAGCLDRLDGPQGRLIALYGHDLLVDLDRGRLFAAGLGFGDEMLLEGVLALPEEGDLRVVVGRFGHQVEQVERAAAGRGQVADDGAGDAAGRAGDHKDGVLVEGQAGAAVGRRLLDQRDGVAGILEVADLDHAGVAQRLGNEQVGRAGCLAARLEVDHLHQGVAPLALVGLRETGHRAAEGRGRAVGAVAVQATQPRGRDEERARCGDGVVERPHGGVEVLNAHAIQFAPRRQVHLFQPRLHVECGQPVDALNGAAGQPRAELRFQRLGRRGLVEGQRRRAELLQPGDQRLADATLVEHDDDAAVGVERDAGGLAQVERRPQRRDGHAAGHGVGLRQCISWSDE